MSVLIKTQETSFPVGSVPSLGTLPSSKEKLPSDVATLVQLHAALASLEDEKDSSKSTSSNPTLEEIASQDTTATMQLAMSKLAGVLAGLEEELLKYQQQTEEMQNEVGNIFVKSAQEQLQKAQQAYQQEQAAEAAQSKEGLMMKIFGGILTALSIIAAVFMGPEMLVMTAALVTLQYTGGLNDLTNAITKGLSNVMPPAIAKIVADVITTLVIVVASAGVGSVGSAAAVANTAESAATTAARAGEEGAEDAASAATDAAEDATSTTATSLNETAVETVETAATSATRTAQSATKFVENAEKFIGKLTSLFGRFRTNGVAFAKMFGTMTGVQTGLPGDIAKAAGASDKVADIINGVVGFIAAIYTAKVAFTESSTVGWGTASRAASAVASSVSKTLSSILPEVAENFLIAFGKYIQSAQFATLAKTLGLIAQAGAMIGEVGVNASTYKTDMQLSETQRALADVDSRMAFFETMEKMSSSLNQQMQQSMTDSVTEVGQQINSVTASFLKPLAAEVSVLQE